MKVLAEGRNGGIGMASQRHVSANVSSAKNHGAQDVSDWERALMRRSRILVIALETASQMSSRFETLLLRGAMMTIFMTKL